MDIEHHAQVAPRTRVRLVNGRTLLWCAWSLPGLLTVSQISSVTGIAAAICVTAGLAGMLSFLPLRLWRACCVLSVVALPFTLWWCGAATVGGTGPDYEAAVAALQTNSSEVRGAFAVVAAYPSFFFAVSAHVACLLLACRAALGRSLADPRTAVGGTWVQSALLVSLLPLAVISLIAARGSGPEGVALFGPATLSSPLGSLEEIAAHKIRLLLWYREQEYHRRAAVPALHVTRPVLAIFVLGESVRADSYGPARTRLGHASKQLAERIAAGLGSWLPTTCASSDATHLSVPMLLTNTPPAHRGDAASSPTVLGILHADGFATAWLANNEAGPDAREAGHDLYAGRFRVNPDSFLWDKLQSWKFDQDAIPAARKFADHIDRPKAMLLHFIGSHVPYESRYPEDFFPREPVGLGAAESTRLRYERSLEYGAYVILRVAAILDATAAPAFLVYTSDHGENLPDDHSGFLLHLGPWTNQLDGTVSSFVLWNRAMADTGRPAQALSRLRQARQIAHVDVAQLYLALASAAAVPVEPTANPTIWGRVAVGDEYAAIRCAALRP